MVFRSSGPRRPGLTLARDVPASDEVIDALQNSLHAGIKFVQVGDDRNTGSARPARGGSRRSRIMAIDVKRAGADDPLVVKLFGPEDQAVVALPKNGALAGVIDKDESLLAGTARRREKMRFDAKARELRAMERHSAVVPNFAHVARA